LWLFLGLKAIVMSHNGEKDKIIYVKGTNFYEAHNIPCSFLANFLMSFVVLCFFLNITTLLLSYTSHCRLIVVHFAFYYCLLLPYNYLLLPSIAIIAL
jgi:hypothetical protein